MAVDKATLLARRIVEGVEHEIDGVGTVTIRGLSRAQVLALRKMDDTAKADATMVSWGLVEPALTVAEAQTWQQNSLADEIEKLTIAIGELSAQGAGATKSGVPGVRE